VRNSLRTAFLTNLLFVFIEGAGGVLTNSVAILSDAVHDLGDCIALAGAWVLEGVARRKPDEKYTYGYRRFSVLSALITLTILFVGSAVMIVASVKRIIHPQTVRAGWMLVLALIGMGINGFAVLKTRDRRNTNEKAINLHMLEDVLGWAAVLVGSVLIHIFKKPGIDGILSLAVSVYILVEALRGLPDTMAVLLERAPGDFKTAELEKALLSHPDAREVHHIHVWSLSDTGIAATAHIVVGENFSFSTLHELYEALEERAAPLGISHLTCQVETGGCCDTLCSPKQEEQGSHHHHG